MTIENWLSYWAASVAITTANFARKVHSRKGHTTKSVFCLMRDITVFLYAVMNATQKESKKSMTQKKEMNCYTVVSARGKGIRPNE